MMHGEVVKIRLNPQDVLGCIDLVEGAGVNTQGMSLAMVVRLALSSCLDGLRHNKIIPQQDGYDYSMRVEKYKHAAAGAKLSVTATIMQNEFQSTVAGMPSAPFAQSFAAGAAIGSAPDVQAITESIVDSFAGRRPELSTREVRNIKMRLAELAIKEQAGDDWSAADIIEKASLSEKLYPT